MNAPRHTSRAAFTLVELLIGMALALVVLTAVLNTYILLARNFTRSLGITSSYQPTLSAQTRNTLAIFTQDATSAIAIQGTPSSSAVTLTVPTTTNTNTIAYYYNNTSSPVTTTLAGYSKTVPANSLVRVDGNTAAMLTLQSGLLSLNFRYFDTSDNLYTVFNYGTAGFNSYQGIKQISVDFTCQGGSATNGTLTQVYTANSPRLLMRNKSLLQ